MSAKRRTAPSRPQCVLLLDIGNSRLKWALQRGPHRRAKRFAASGVIELKQLLNRGAFLLRLAKLLDPKLSIEACNVAGAAVEKQLRTLVRRAGLRAPHFVRSAHSAGGVRNAYAQPWRLGADRWAALIGAHSEFPDRSLCLVAVGTAMTIDLLDAKGRHRGGNIIPGPQLMIQALLEHTAGIRRRAGGRKVADSPRATRKLFAHDTRHAITAGAVHAAAALIVEATRSARVLLGGTPRLILSGGAAAAVGPLLRTRHLREDDLALRGLAVLRSQKA
jgi:type III pantothenate kinase